MDERDSDVSRYKISALDAVTFHLVFKPEDLVNGDDKYVFKPTMAHQIFGESESIFGYHCLTIDLYHLHNSSQCYVDIKKSEQINGIEGDDIIGALNPWLPENYTTNESTFKEWIEKEEHSTVFGNVIDEFELPNLSTPVTNESRSVKYKITICDLEDADFVKFHQRYETFTIWLIDAANFIDVEDEKWIIFYLYEEVEDPATKQPFVTPIGFCTVYKFFAYPENIRARISQFLVLPPHQRRNLGSAFYQAIYKKLREWPNIVDITVEEPFEGFQRMRDVCDSLYIYRDLKAAGENFMTKHRKRLFDYLRKQKICKRQIPRIIDVLHYVETFNDKAETKKYDNSIKARIVEDVKRELKPAKMWRGDIEQLPQSRLVDEVGVVEGRYSKYVEEIKAVVAKLQSIISLSNGI